MKITIAYLPEEQQQANSLLRCLQSFLGDSLDRVRESDRHAPFKHTYLNTRKPGKTGSSKRNT